MPNTRRFETSIKHQELILDFNLSPCSECCMVSSGSEFYMSTFRNTLCSIFIRQVGMKYTPTFWTPVILHT